MLCNRQAIFGVPRNIFGDSSCYGMIEVIPEGVLNYLDRGIATRHARKEALSPVLVILITVQQPDTREKRR